MAYIYDFEKILLIEKMVKNPEALQQELHLYATNYFKVNAQSVKIVSIKQFKTIFYYIQVNNIYIGLELKCISVYNKDNPGNDSFYFVIEDMSCAKTITKPTYHVHPLKQDQVTTPEFKAALQACFGVFVKKVQCLTKPVEILTRQIKEEVRKHKNFLSLDESDLYTRCFEEKIEGLSIYKIFTVSALSKDEHFTIHLDATPLQKIYMHIYDVQFDNNLNVSSKQIQEVFESTKDFESRCGKIVQETVQSVLYNCYSV